MAQQDLSEFLATFWPAFGAAESNGDLSQVALLCSNDLVSQSPSEEPCQTLSGLIEARSTPPADYQIEFGTVEVIADENLAVARGSSAPVSTARPATLYLSIPRTP